VTAIPDAIAELERQRDAIDQALAALRTIGAPNSSRTTLTNSAGKVTRKRRRLSETGRRNIIAALKKRHAEKRAAKKMTVSKHSASAKKPNKRALSPEARKKMADASRKRWAAWRKAQVA